MRVRLSTRAILSGKVAGGEVAPPVVAGVNYERILNAREEPQNWLTYYGAYDGQRYSPLDQINTENVKRLGPAWIFQAGTTGLIAGASTYSFEAAPIVVEGVMFLSGWDGWVWALDARTGVEIWRYKHAVPFDVSLCCGNVNRGVAVAAGKVFFVTANAHVLALDATTGKRVWDKTYGDVRAGESATVAPLVVKNMVIVGSSGGEFGVRGHLDAFDLETGEHQWRCYTVPKPGEPGSDTWPADGEAWARGGANCWVTGTFDPETNLLYVGTGNPAPDFDGEVREGDNLYTDSVIAVDVDSGQIRWHYQCTPHDVWDYDSIAECILFEEDGRKLLGHFDKNGYFFVLDRTNGELRQRDAVRGPDRLGRHHPRRQGDPAQVPGQGGRTGPLLPGSGRRQGMDARRLQPENRPVLRPGAGYAGPRPPGGAGSSRRASRTGARAFRWTSRTWRGPSARSTPTVRRSGAGATSFRCARRCSPRAAIWCSPVNPPGSSTRSTPAAGS